MDNSRYQRGSLEKRKTAEGLCWFLRFRQNTKHGDSPRPRFRIGLVADLPTKTAARRAADALSKDFNRITKAKPDLRLFCDLVEKYKAEEMPQRYSTGKSYQSILKCHIVPRWGALPIVDVRPNDVREWLRNLDLSPKTRGHIRDLMRVLFRYAMLIEWIPIALNPITLFQLPGTTKRRRKPRSLSIGEFFELLDHIPKEPYRTMVFVAACLGLRCSELFGLRWGDFDWEQQYVKVQRAIVDGRVGPVKTEQSEKALPVHPLLAALLLAHLKRTPFKELDDYVFASPHSAGEKPYHSYRIQQYMIAPAARAADLGDGIGWHTFRHSYRSWLAGGGATQEIQRDLMRHTDIRTTMNIYGDTQIEPLRTANEKVVGSLLQ